MSYQLKILTTALFSVAILNKFLTRLQWVSLILLFVGVAVVQLQPSQASPAVNSTEQSLVIGLSAICTASMMSGFAGIYFEKLLKHTSPSIFLRNVQLGVIGIVFGLVAMYINDQSKVCSYRQHYMHSIIPHLRHFLVKFFDVMVMALLFLKGDHTPTERWWGAHLPF